MSLRFDECFARYDRVAFRAEEQLTITLSRETVTALGDDELSCPARAGSHDTVCEREHHQLGTSLEPASNASTVRGAPERRDDAFDRVALDEVAHDGGPLHPRRDDGSSAKATKLARPAGAYALRLRIGLVDDVTDNEVSYTVRAFGPGGRALARRFGTARTETVSMTMRVRPRVGARTVRLELTAEDPVGNKVSVWPRPLRLPR